MKPDKESYKKILNQLESGIGLTKTHKPLFRIDRVSKYIGVLNKVADLKAQMRGLIIQANQEADLRKNLLF
jgi:hypothetical protein